MQVGDAGCRDGLDEAEADVRGQLLEKRTATAEQLADLRDRAMTQHHQLGVRVRSAAAEVAGVVVRLVAGDDRADPSTETARAQRTLLMMPPSF